MDYNMSDRQGEIETHQADSIDPRRSALGRRDLVKLGASVIATALGAGNAPAQDSVEVRRRGIAEPPPGQPPPPGPRPHTAPGYKYTANRVGGNGPMDDTTRKIVEYVRKFDESMLTEPVVKAVNRVMVDSMAASISGFETTPARVAARMARYAQPVELKATVLGYGVTTTPELAAFANGVLVRETDLNDAPSHISNLIPGALAIGEALHSTGAQVMTAIAMAYDVWEVPGVGESVPPAMAAGKLLGLDEDRLANALSIALTAHVALNKGVGTLSMWKGVRSAEATKCGIWSALLAREGMTGPPQPVEGRGGLWASKGRREFNLPIRKGQLAIERQWFKRHPAGAYMQAPLMLIPEIRKWTTPEEVAWITVDMDEIGENADNPKWDPPNRETADHSLPYVIARAMIDGDFWLDSFTEAKLKDPKAHELMDKMTFGQVESWRGSGPMRITIHKKNGEERFWDTFEGKRQPGYGEYPRLSDEEVLEKFNRVCDFHKVNKAQRDRARNIWWNLREVKDIGEAIQALAKFGEPKPLKA
jgi:2-methylcitrate dehydratase